MILNWNQVDLTLDCLASIYQQDYANFRIVLVDNGSTDGSTEKIRAQFPAVKVIENGRNLGYSKGNNIGIVHALEQKADYILLLNNDTIVDQQMVRLLVQAAEQDPAVGITGPTMLYYDQPDIIWCGGNRINWANGEPIRLNEGKSFSTIQALDKQEVDFITSCAVCIKRAVFEKIGLIDEKFFIYFDEIDWFARAKAAGWKTVYIPSAKLWHKVSAAMGESSPGTDYYMVRNRFLFIFKNMQGLVRLRTLLYFGLFNIKVIVAYTLKSHQGKRIRNRNAKFLGMRDAVLGRWGEMGSDVRAALR